MEGRSAQVERVLTLELGALGCWDLGGRQPTVPSASGLLSVIRPLLSVRLSVNPLSPRSTVSARLKMDPKLEPQPTSVTVGAGHRATSTGSAHRNSLWAQSQIWGTVAQLFFLSYLVYKFPVIFVT